MGCEGCLEPWKYHQTDLLYYHHDSGSCYTGLWGEQSQTSSKCPPAWWIFHFLFCCCYLGGRQQQGQFVKYFWRVISATAGHIVQSKQQLEDKKNCEQSGRLSYWTRGFHREARENLLWSPGVFWTTKHRILKFFITISISLCGDSSRPKTTRICDHQKKTLYCVSKFLL